MGPGLERILDANLNRAREGLRVAEEIARLVLEDAPLQAAFKAARHAVASAERRLDGGALLRSRASDRDPGSGADPRRENRRQNYTDLARANLRRAQEALRVLEEVSKLRHAAVSVRFKRIRFQTYELERKLAGRLQRPARTRRASR